MSQPNSILDLSEEEGSLQRFLVTYTWVFRRFEISCTVPSFAQVGVIARLTSLRAADAAGSVVPAGGKLPEVEASSFPSVIYWC